MLLTAGGEILNIGDNFACFDDKFEHLLAAYTAGGMSDSECKELGARLKILFDSAGPEFIVRSEEKQGSGAPMKMFGFSVPREYGSKIYCRCQIMVSLLVIQCAHHLQTDSFTFSLVISLLVI